VKIAMNGGETQTMNITRILIELKAQRNKLNDAIAALESLAPRASKQAASKTRRPKSGSTRRRPASKSPRNSHPSASAKIIPFRRPRRVRAKSSQAEQA
jgi:hypothetical protein